MSRYLYQSFTIISIILCICLSPSAVVKAQISQPLINIQPDKLYGFEPFKPANPVPYEYFSIDNGKIEFMSYRLVARDEKTHSREDIYNWSKDSKDTKVYRQEKTNDGTAVINVAFWGVSPKPGTSSTLIQPAKQNPYKMSQLFIDAIAMSASTLIKTDNIQELTLLIIPIPKDSELNTYLKNELKAVHSEFLYILCNKQAIIDKPDFNGIEYKKYEEFTLHLPKLTSGNIFFLSDNKFKIQYSLITNEQSTPIRFISTDNPLSYDAFKIDRVEFIKPKGFNLIPRGVPDTTGYLNEKLTVIAHEGQDDFLQITPVNYQCIYIDASQVKNKSRTSQLLEEIISSPGGFMIFLSNKNQPIIARNKEELASLQTELYNITFQPPMVLDDINKMSSTTKLESISKRVVLNYSLILSNDIYKDKFKEIRNNLQQQCKCTDATFTVYLDIPEDEMNDKIKGVKYVFLN